MAFKLRPIHRDEALGGAAVGDGLPGCSLVSKLTNPLVEICIVR